ncbi:MAG: Hsp20/alpha crystallin family protein, partial [Burkholderiales bacterium]
NQVSISADVKKENDAKEGETVLRSERSYGQAIRSFALAQEVDEGKSQAKYSNGVLELSLPKKAYAQAKKLEIL